ncbi:hypothetical protein [Planctomicrobium piriforme]|uniref:Trypsin-like peptidase domain-containing protein n=1 Tax=Planctomicrobium piriforme TaxID=1576369 RepID=A0A1I3AUP4_9PLAN|nr:hypothetical protein [Planctomicrobium piriforme]SFH53670.1 hypothetical protein SAMN05421753_10164 [Planctomicrobium piriforme]
MNSTIACFHRSRSAAHVLLAVIPLAFVATGKNCECAEPIARHERCVLLVSSDSPFGESRGGLGFIASRDGRYFLVTTSSVAKRCEAGTQVLFSKHNPPAKLTTLGDASNWEHENPWMTHVDPRIAVLVLNRLGKLPELAKPFAEIAIKSSEVTSQPVRIGERVETVATAGSAGQGGGSLQVVFTQFVGSQAIDWTTPSGTTVQAFYLTPGVLGSLSGAPVFSYSKDSDVASLIGMRWVNRNPRENEPGDAIIPADAILKTLVELPSERVEP